LFTSTKSIKAASSRPGSSQSSSAPGFERRSNQFVRRCDHTTSIGGLHENDSNRSASRNSRQALLHAATAQQPGIKRTDLRRHDISIPGYEAIQTRGDFATGATFPKHKHPGEEVIYAIEGSIEYDLEGKPPVTVNAGGVLFIPAGTVHAAENVGTVNAAELGTYVVEKGKPLVALVE